MTTNLEDHPKLRVGNSITLKDHHDPDQWWEIVFVSSELRKRSHLNRKWNNNI